MDIKNKANKILKFLDKVSKEVYSEPDTAMHMGMIDKIVPDLEKKIISKGQRQSIHY